MTVFYSIGANKKPYAPTQDQDCGRYPAASSGVSLSSDPFGEPAHDRERGPENPCPRPRTGGSSGRPVCGGCFRWPCPAGPLTSPSKNEHHLRSAFCAADGASGAEKDRSSGQASSASEVLLAGQARAAAGMASAPGEPLSRPALLTHPWRGMFSEDLKGCSFPHALLRRFHRQSHA